MKDFAISCTEDQARKALELGAPIERWHLGNLPFHTYENGKACDWNIPTAEEMIGWLEAQKNIKEMSVYCDVTGLNWYFEGYKNDGSHAFVGRDSYLSRKEATLAAIDAALEYLSKHD